MSDRKCPNCGAVGVAGKDDSFACPTCGGSFTFKTGEPKLTAVGELDELRSKVAAHDADLAELKKTLPASKPAEPSADPDEDEGEEDEDEEEDV